MANFDLPTPGQPNWGAKLNDSLLNLNGRVPTVIGANDDISLLPEGKLVFREGASVAGTAISQGTMVIQVRADTESSWAVANPVLSKGEGAYSTDKGVLRVGDGSTIWALLPKVGNTPKESVLSFGVKGDGVTDDTVALQAALDAKINLYFPPLSYRTSSALVAYDLPGTTWQAEGANIITTSDVALHIGKATNAKITGLGLTTIKDDATEHYAGVLTMDRPTIDGLTFTRCYYSAPKRGINGVKVILDDQPAGSFKRVKWIDCTFKNIGRMGLEVQDHSATKIIRALDVLAKGCVFEGVATLSQGIVCSWSGVMSGCGTVDCSFIGGTTTCIEYVDGQISPYVHGNTFRGLADQCSPIAFTNPNSSAPVTGMTMHNNRSLDRSGGQVVLRNLVHPIMSGNYFTLEAGFLNMLGVLDAVSMGDTYDTRAVYAIYYEGGTQNSRFTDTTVATNKAGTFSMIRGNGNTSYDNVFERTVIKNIIDGAVMDDINGAYGNYMLGHKIFGQKSTGVKEFDITNGNPGGGAYEQSAELFVMTGTPTAARTFTILRGKRSFTVTNSTTQNVTVTLGVGASITVAAGATQAIISTGATLYKR